MLRATGQEVVPGLRLTQCLGAGGFGEVWEAADDAGKTVALKFLDCQGKPPQTIANELRVLLSLRELRHPHIIQLSDVFTVSGHLVLQMERADGSLFDLQQVCREDMRTNVPPDFLLDLLAQAAAALDFLAEFRPSGASRISPAGGMGLQHCDVKPSNLLLVNGQLKVADFGLCGAMRLHGTGGFRGTPPYAAPELYEGRPTRHTDQYALAVTFCELVAADRMFHKGGAKKTQAMEASGEYPGLPIDLSRARAREWPVLARALDRNWMGRWPSCQAFVSALRKAAESPRSKITIPFQALRAAAQRSRTFGS